MYNQTRYFAGATIDNYNIKPTKHKKGARSKKLNPTSEKVMLQNELLAKDKFIRKMNANFTADDYHLILTFKKEKRPTPAQAQKIYRAILDKARYQYKRHGIVFKYMTAFGFLSKDEIEETKGKTDCEHNEAVPHFHFVVKHIDFRVWTKIWREYGRAMIFPLDERGDYSKLAGYFFDHTRNNFRADQSPVKQRYACSRNLINPKPKKKKVNAEKWRELPKPLKGYYIDWDSYRVGVSEVTGYPYQFYRMIKINPRE